MGIKANTLANLGSRIALVSVYCLLSVVMNAQTIDEFDLGGSDIDLILLRAAHRINGPMPITIDHGQFNKGYNKTQKVKDPEGNELNFNSIAGALDAFQKMGWSYVDSYTIVEGDASFICFVLQRQGS